MIKKSIRVISYSELSFVEDNLDTNGNLHFEDGEFTHKSTGYLNRYKD